VENLENRHATAKKLTSELLKKFQETNDELKIISTLPQWIAPWQIPISSKEITKYEKLLETKKREEKEKERTNIKIENLFRLAEWILQRQKTFREELDSESSSSSDDKKKSKSRRNVKGSKKGSRRDVSGSKKGSGSGSRRDVSGSKKGSGSGSRREVSGSKKGSGSGSRRDVSGSKKGSGSGSKRNVTGSKGGSKKGEQE